MTRRLNSMPSKFSFDSHRVMLKEVVLEESWVHVFRLNPQDLRDWERDGDILEGKRTVENLDKEALQDRCKELSAFISPILIWTYCGYPLGRNLEIQKLLALGALCFEMNILKDIWDLFWASKKKFKVKRGLFGMLESSTSMRQVCWVTSVPDCS